MYIKENWNQEILVELQAANDDGLLTEATYDAGVLTLDGAQTVSGRYSSNIAPQFLVITAAGNESGNTFTFVGRDLSGRTYTYEVAGPNATTLIIPVAFSDIAADGISISEDTSGTIKIGTVAQTATPWCEIDIQRLTNDGGITVGVEGVLNYSIQWTNDNAKLEVPTTIINDTTLSNQTATGATPIWGRIRFARLIVNSWTSGTVKFQLVQAGGAHALAKND